MPNDVTVTRQVLAEPDAGLADRTWATLADGTPLVTAQRRGKGLIVLFHVTADTRWSDLPLSGAFVDMLRAHRRARRHRDRRRDASADRGASRARRRCRRPACSTASARSRRRRRPRGRCRRNFAGRANADHPPGFYGPPEGLLAVNTLAPADRLAPLDVAPLNARARVYRHGEPLDLRGPVFLAALALLLLDALVVFWLAGGLAAMLPRRARRGDRRSSSALLAALAWHAPRAGASRAAAAADAAQPTTSP